ncbi:hypothetical protein SAMN04487949_1726 [Halogranum gelatinilyticum]|uniref:Small CPxCG-related zinc finger protein n=2 Tax=Halogranum gelatinilyticum TaxID=660521 RepID=A0A1G9TDK8_9EURY|nr:hypothetical protein SAMN04487949_1726 [Halogranum gelatinilyticum]
MSFPEQRRCPDCGVTMERTTPVVVGGGSEVLKLRTAERAKGLLGSLGMKETIGVTAHVCPECGLTRLYADLDEE